MFESIFAKILELIFWIIFSVLLYYTGYLIIAMLTLGYSIDYFSKKNNDSRVHEVICQCACVAIGILFYMLVASLLNR